MEQNQQPSSNIDSGLSARIALSSTRRMRNGRLGSIFLTILGGIAAIILLLVTISFQAAGAHVQPLGTITVDTLEDEEIVNGSCSLREAITAANINYGVDKCPAGRTITDTITFAVQGTITLTNQLPYILNAGPLLIDGGENIVISGNDNHRVFWVNPGTNLALSDLKVVRSRWPNGAIAGAGGYGMYNNGGVVNIQRCEFSNNNCYEYPGGAVYNSGSMTISQSKFEHNFCSQGGAIANVKTMAIIESTFLDNHSWGYMVGGGAIWNDGVLSILDSTLNQNYTFEGGGGAIWNDGVLSIFDSTLNQNEAPPGGGAIVNSNIMSITNSTFSDNISGDYTSDCEYGGKTLRNSGWITVNHSTIVDAAAEESVLICNQKDSTLIIQNSIVASTPPYTNCLGTIIDGGFNIDSQDTCGFDTAHGSLVDTDPQLGVLQNNGGPTWTHAPLAGSPAIDAANPVDCPSTDQRGVPRPFDGDGDGNSRCDIGAYEVVPPGIQRATQTSITSITPDPPLVNKPIIVEFLVLSDYGIPTGTVTVTVENSPATCSTQLSAGAGSCDLLLPQIGVYTLTATYAGEGDYQPSAGSRPQSVSLYGAFLPQILHVFPPAIQITWSGIRVNRLGSYEMNGSVFNGSDVIVYGVSLSAVLYDSTGKTIGTYSGSAALPATFPDESNPFSFPVGSELPGDYDLLAHWSYASPVQYAALSVISQTTSGICPAIVVGGVIRNDEQVELEGIKVIVEPGGAAEIYGVADLGADSLLPGDTTVFSHTQDYIAPPCPSEFQVRGQGQQVP